MMKSLVIIANTGVETMASMQNMMALAKVLNFCIITAGKWNGILFLHYSFIDSLGWCLYGRERQQLFM